MYEGGRELSDEEVGIRAFKVKKAKAVERAIERIRHGMGSSWTELTEEEIEELEWVLGEVWSYVARADWDDLHFGRITTRDVVRMLTLSSQLRRHARNQQEILREVAAILGHAGEFVAPPAEPEA